MVGCIVTSMAGHDKGRTYMVIRTEGEFAYLADGRLKTWAKPKKKRLKHIQAGRSFSGGIKEKLESGSGLQDIDVEIKRMIKLYEARKI